MKQSSNFSIVRRSTILVIGMMAFGCAPKHTKSDTLLGLTAGMSTVEIQRRIGSVHTHQFTALVDGDELLAVTQDFRDPSMRFYLVHRNHSLVKIIDVLPESMYRIGQPTGQNRTDRCPMNPEQRMHALLAAPSLSDETVRARIDRLREYKARSKEYSKKYNEGGVLVAALVLTAPLAPLAWPRQISQHAEKQRLLRQYDPWKIRLGMTSDEVDAALGKPRRVVLEGDDEIRVYGELEYPWIVVTLQDGRVIRVFSHNFVDVALRGSRSTYSQ